MNHLQSVQLTLFKDHKNEDKITDVITTIKSKIFIVSFIYLWNPKPKTFIIISITRKKKFN